MSNFTFEYSKILTGAIGKDLRDNHDIHRFGSERTGAFGIKECLKENLAKLGLVSTGTARQTVDLGLCFVEPYLAGLEWLYDNLADEESRRWLVSLAAYRALGHRKIKLPTNNPAFWKAKDLAARIPCGSEEIDAQFLGWKLHERDLNVFGYPIRMFCGYGACYTTFVHEQYRCGTADGTIEATEGDVAIDAGGCYGDTALYLAHKVGARGRVASFEFLPFNVSVFRKNMELNPDLASRIRLYENPVYSQGGHDLFVVANGPGTRVTPQSSDPSAHKVKTVKIDDLVTNGDFPRIDFIKMDIEGAELQALRGSEKVLRRFKPKLAITVYHDFKDFWTIPQFLDGLGLGYRFYLRHFTIHAEETVLFAAAR